MPDSFYVLLGLGIGILMIFIPGMTSFVGAVKLAPEEFLKLVTKEEVAIVFFVVSRYGKHSYLTTVKGNKIYASGSRLCFPQHCELVKLKRF